MNLDRVSSGKNVPDDINVIIEIPSHSDPVKYEVDKETGALFVDRFMNTAMFYPCNYGYVPHTLSDDGDPVDVLVISPYALISGSVVQCRPVGMLKMTDESGEDAKVLAVPHDKMYDDIKDISDVSERLLSQLAHFFEHYKDLEKNKWVKIDGWENKAAAHQEIMDSVARFKAAPVKPQF
ncbi:Inorganic pyrophosphatase [Methylophaga frappieri]|uniref:Inorganic pyrophosphatase n=1 Tax=Methylophaga frappieri (strain ATCC BAA-2434 / DSM 25690 / JAM7) TaxID=754477 RepID=I1YL01_METFJ|nr:inorganic diphosphatase [Methylophaga frappieri]AFJ03594.1 Inorganic pyrophosphatase [Methylophaga frappieri]